MVGLTCIFVSILIHSLTPFKTIYDFLTIRAGPTPANLI